MRISLEMGPVLEIFSTLSKREKAMTEVIEVFDNDVEYLMAVQF